MEYCASVSIASSGERHAYILVPQTPFSQALGNTLPALHVNQNPMFHPPKTLTPTTLLRRLATHRARNRKPTDKSQGANTIPSTQLQLTALSAAWQVDPILPFCPAPDAAIRCADASDVTKLTTYLVTVPSQPRTGSSPPARQAIARPADDQQARDNDHPKPFVIGPSAV